MKLLKRQLLSYFLILTLCLGMFPATVASAETETGENM